MSKIVYLGNKNQSLIGKENLYLNEDGVVIVKEGSWQDNLCKSYNLKNLEELFEKYCEKPRGIIGKILGKT